MATGLVLVRHATCAQTHEVLLGRVLDPPLDSHGAAQAEALAEALAERLEGALPPLLQCSPRLRTWQTACAIGARVQRPVRCAEALDEVDYGRWGGQRFDALEGEPAWRCWNADRAHARTPAGEDMAALRARIGAHLCALAAAHPARTLIIVSHAEPIRALLLHALGLSAARWQQVPVEPASFSRLRIVGGRFKVDATNETAGPRAAQGALPAQSARGQRAATHPMPHPGAN